MNISPPPHTIIEPAAALRNTFIHRASTVEGFLHYGFRISSKSSKAALHLIGSINNFYSSVKERFIPKLSSRSTLPPVFDDVKIRKLVENILVSFYNMGKDGTCLEECLPRTCPIITVNWKTLDGLERNPRYVRLCHNFTFS